MAVEDGAAVVSFDHVGGGLVAPGDKPHGFAVAGADGVFHPAEAVIRGETVVVRSDKVAKPVSVRYGWKNWPEADLASKNGLPAAPFRTDDLPLTTGPKK
jgi:sialate O-acetylesterase